MFVEQNLSRFLAVFSGSRGELRRHCGTPWQGTSLWNCSKVCTLAVRPEMTIAELTEEMKVESGQHVPNNNDVKLVQWKSRSCDLEQNTKGYQKDHGLFAVQGFFEWVGSPYFLPTILPDSSTNCNNQGGFPEESLGCKASITLWKYAIHFLLSRVEFLYMLCFQGNSMKLMWRRHAFPFRLSIPLRMSLLGDSAQWSLWRGEAEWSPDDRRVYPRLCQSAGTLEKNKKSKYSRDWGLKTDLTWLKAPLFGEETLDAKVTQLLNTFDMCGHDLWKIRIH